MEKELQLGMEVKDRITGYQGIAIAKTIYMQGCDRILVQRQMTADDKSIIPEPQAFDEPDMVIVGYGILPKPKKERKPGGPRPFANRSPGPTSWR